MSKKVFKKHCNWHDDGGKAYTCSLCSRVFEFTYHLQSHQATHKEPTFKCSVHTSCGKDGNPKKFTFKRDLVLHKTYSKKPKLFECRTYKKLFT